MSISSQHFSAYSPKRKLSQDYGFYILTPYSVVDTNVSEERSAYIFVADVTFFYNLFNDAFGIPSPETVKCG
jgi:hypothetical protein